MTKEIVKQEEFGNSDINRIQDLIKTTVSDNGGVYKAGKYERGRIKNMFQGEFRKHCDRYNSTVDDMVVKLINTAYQVNYFAVINNGETLYKHFAKIWTEAVQLAKKLQEDVIDLSHGLDYFKTPKKGVKYVIHYTTRNEYWILEEDIAKVNFAKAQKKTVKALGGDTFNPAFVSETKRYYIPNLVALSEPTSPKKPVKKETIELIRQKKEQSLKEADERIEKEQKEFTEKKVKEWSNNLLK